MAALALFEDGTRDLVNHRCVFVFQIVPFTLMKRDLGDMSFNTSDDEMQGKYNSDHCQFLWQTGTNIWLHEFNQVVFIRGDCFANTINDIRASLILH